MAELPIERNERPVWPWLLAVLALVALGAWFFLGRDNGRDRVATLTSVAVPAAVTEFLTYADGQRAANAAGLSHEYTVDGLRRLAAALAAVAGQDTVLGRAVQPRVAAMRERADSLQQDAQSTSHARNTREAALLAAGLFQAVQESQYPANAAQAADVRTAAEGINADELLLRQKPAVERFFDSAAAALRGMWAAGSA